MCLIKGAFVGEWNLDVFILLRVMKLLRSAKQVALLLFHCNAFSSCIVDINSYLVRAKYGHCCFPGNVNAPCSYVMLTLPVLFNTTRYREVLKHKCLTLGIVSLFILKIS